MYFEKLLVYVITAVLSSNIAAALVLGDWNNPTVLWGLLVTVLGAIVVFLKQNTVTQPFAKKIIAVFVAVALTIVDAATDHHISAAEVVQIALAFIAAVQVSDTQNNTSVPRPGPTHV